ncbi:MAG: hypothetical protein EAZ85_11090 [Bacteroidetes bacterium]|nr:MAG: hypothetical protein EAZ85_11090 [Bacteroidota bacterium]TAG89735.1 MAG: hypothetical protein EAZ20_05835 [Bacteroidota bacterium]
MYTAIKGIFKDGKVILQETPPTTELTEVVVMFMKTTQTQDTKQGVRLESKRQAGSLQKLGQLEGKTYSIPDDFNEPLDDLKDYM